MKKGRWVALAALAFCWTHAADAQTQTCKRYPRMATGQDVQIRRAPDGSIWYASQNANRIVKVDSKFAETPFVPVDGSTGGLSGLVIDDAGNVWFSKTKGIVGRFPMVGGEGVEYSIPEEHAFPRGLTMGPDGALWYFDPVKKNLGRVARNGSVELIPAPPRLNPFVPSGMAAGGDNSIWVTDRAQNALFRYDIAGKSWKRFDIPHPDAHPASIRVAKDGSVWFIMTAAQKLGRLRNGTFTDFDLDKERPAGLHVADDQSIWFTTTRGTIGRIKPDGTREKYRCETLTGPLTTAADGTVYALGNQDLVVLKPGDVVAAPKVVNTGNVQGPDMVPFGPSPVRDVTLEELRKLFEDRSQPLVVHYTVHRQAGCGPCDESWTVFDEFARKHVGKATFVRLAKEYSTAAWDDPWIKTHAPISAFPTFVTYQAQKESGRVVGKRPVATLERELLPPR